MILNSITQLRSSMNTPFSISFSSHNINKQSLYYVIFLELLNAQPYCVSIGERRIDAEPSGTKYVITETIMMTMRYQGYAGN
jgi:hypothetical protein